MPQCTLRFQMDTIWFNQCANHVKYALNILLSPFKSTSCLLYLDDVIIFFQTAEDHISHVGAILKTVKRTGITLKLMKLELLTDKIIYLCQVVKPGGVETGKLRPESLREAMREAKVPKNQSQVRRLLGLCDAYRRFLKDFRLIPQPLNSRFRKEETVNRRPSCPRGKHFFQKLKYATHLTPKMASKKPFLPNYVDTDAS